MWSCATIGICKAKCKLSETKSAVSPETPSPLCSFQVSCHMIFAHFCTFALATPLSTQDNLLFKRHWTFFVNFMYMSWPSCTWGARRWWWGCRGARRPGTPRSRGRRTSASSQGSPDTCRVHFDRRRNIAVRLCAKITSVSVLSSQMRSSNESVSSLFICHLFPRANRRDKKWAHNENNTTGRGKKGLCVILRKGDNRKVTKASYRTWNKGADKNCLQSVMLIDFSVWFPLSDKLFRDSSSLVEKFILYNLLLSVFSDFRFFRQKTNFSSLSQ